MAKFAKPYDKIAPEYDGHYVTEENLQENRELKDMLDRIIGPSDSVLDIGCGTGLCLDLVDIVPEDYLGIDPSEGMLGILTLKYPAHRTIHGSYEEHDFPKVDVAVALFSAHYIPDKDKTRLLTQADRYLYIFNKPDYNPEWIHPDSQEAEAIRKLTDYDWLYENFELEEWHNYLIAYKT